MHSSAHLRIVLSLSSSKYEKSGFNQIYVCFVILKAGTWVNLWIWWTKRVNSFFLLKIQILNPEWLSHLPMKQKYPKNHHSSRFEPNVFSFIGKWLSHSWFKFWILSKKGIHPFSLPDSLKSFPLVGQLVFLHASHIIKWNEYMRKLTFCINYPLLNFGRNFIPSIRKNLLITDNLNLILQTQFLNAP